MYKYCKVAREGRVTIVTLNRPEVMNALHHDAHLELDEIWNAFAEDDEQWVGIVTGEGPRAFCTGNDLKHTAAGGKRPFVKNGHAGLTARFDNDKPIIAAVNGVAVGGGFEVALACDIVIAEEHARFGLTEPKVGTVAAAGGMHRLPRSIGLKRAMGMMLLARLVSAEEGERYGFVNEVVPTGTSLAKAREYAERIISLSPMAIRATKQCVTRGLAIADVSLAYRTEFEALTQLRAGEDYVEGPKAFAEKRAPQWKNK